MIDQMYLEIVDAYGSIEKPNWNFVQRRFEKNLYEDIILQFQKTSRVEETTDINDDYCRVLSMCQAGMALTVRLSLVGRYACIHDPDGRFLSTTGLATNFFGRQVLKILGDANFNVLSEEILRTSIVFGNGSEVLYRILFSSDELVSS